MVEIKVIKSPTKQCANAIYNYKVELIPEEFISWLGQFGAVKITQFTKKFFIFKHQLGLQLSSVVGGQTLKIYGTTDHNSFIKFESQVLDFFTNYEIHED